MNNQQAEQAAQAALAILLDAIQDELELLNDQPKPMTTRELAEKFEDALPDRQEIEQLAWTHKTQILLILKQAAAKDDGEDRKWD